MDRNVIALNRFGLGARPEERIGDPVGWLKRQLDVWQPAVPGSESLTPRREIVRSLASAQKALLVAREHPADIAGGKKASQDLLLTQDRIKAHYHAQVGLRARTAIASETPFIERLVHFWSNHFAISIENAGPEGTAGWFELEAIRPHVLGRFEDMLAAVEQHPAMLMYLDQVYSIGPGSAAGTSAGGQARKLGLNENLAREILELHTLGVRSGYGQADVTEFARALTGWNVAGLGRGAPTDLAKRLGVPHGDFLFVEPMHEPGVRRIMGRRYDQSDGAQGRAVLSDLARHRATARHVATRLARHFTADDPPRSLVARLESVFRSTGGDLRAVYGALIDAPEAWSPTPAKFRTPWEWAIACYRAAALPIDSAAPSTFADLMTELGQTVWMPGSPAGYDDIAASWAAPNALFRRVEAAADMSRRLPALPDPRMLARQLFGDGLSRATADAIAGAADPRQGMALLLIAPEMMRR